MNRPFEPSALTVGQLFALHLSLRETTPLAQRWDTELDRGKALGVWGFALRFTPDECATSRVRHRLVPACCLVEFYLA